MRIFNRVHVPWFVFVCLATLVAAFLYLANFHPGWLPFELPLPAFFGERPPTHQTIGGTPLGLIFGALAFAIFIFAALLSLRKKIPLWRVGTVQRWLRAHIWLTLLTIPLVLFHCGFHSGGPMTTLLLVLYAIVMISGLYGLALQQQMPRMMKDRLPAETVFEQIPFIRAQLCAAAVKMRDSLQPAPDILPDATAAMASTKGELSTPAARAKTATDSNPTAAPVMIVATAPASPAGDPASEAFLVELLDSHILPYLEARRARKHPLEKSRFSEDTFRFAKLRVAEAYRARVEEIQSWCDERRMLGVQARMHHWLHGWLFVHVPFSFLLLLMTGWHAYVGLFRY